METGRKHGKGRDMRIDVTKALWVTAVGLLAVGLAVLIWDPSSSGGGDGVVEGGGTDQVVEHIDGVDDHDDADEQADGVDEHEDADSEDEADEHGDGDNHADLDGDGQANDYLEIAPKDSLALVAMTSFAYTPSVIEVAAGEVLEIAVQNAEPALHDFTIDKVDADVHISYLGGTGQHAHQEPEKDADVHFALTEPASGVVHLKVHEPGEYVIYCTVPGHREAGMEGTLIVN